MPRPPVYKVTDFPPRYDGVCEQSAVVYCLCDKTVTLDNRFWPEDDCVECGIVYALVLDPGNKHITGVKAHDRKPPANDQG